MEVYIAMIVFWINQNYRDKVFTVSSNDDDDDRTRPAGGPSFHRRLGGPLPLADRPPGGACCCSTLLRARSPQVINTTMIAWAENLSQNAEEAAATIETSALELHESKDTTAAQFIVCSLSGLPAGGDRGEKKVRDTIAAGGCIILARTSQLEKFNMILSKLNLDERKSHHGEPRKCNPPGSWCRRRAGRRPELAVHRQAA